MRQAASANLVSTVSAPGDAHRDPHRSYWQARCRRLAGHVFTGRVFEYLGPALLAGALVTACVVLLARLHVLPPRFESVLAYVPVPLAVLTALGLALRRGWPRASDMRVRLEEAYHLHNRLSAATEGTVTFPAPPGHAGGPTEDAKVVTWRWGQVLPLPAASLALLAIAALVPVQPPARVRPGITQKPPPLERLEEIVRQLEAARTVDERTLEELRSQVEELAGRDPEDWYTHAGLEAAESLLQKTESGMNELAGHMTSAATALDQMAGAGEGAGTSAEDSAGLQAALHGLEHGRMPGAGDVAQSIRGAANRTLDAATARQLADALRENSDFLQQLAQGGESRQMQFTQLGAGSSPGNPSGENGEGPGQGGVDRGPGTAPLTIAQNASTAEPGADGALDAFDPERAALGDAAGQSVGRHELDREAAEAAADGGAVATPGTGGEAAWTQRLTPEERRAVKRTFE